MWKLILGRLFSLLRKKSLPKGERKYINGKIILIEEGWDVKHIDTGVGTH